MILRTCDAWAVFGQRGADICCIVLNMLIVAHDRMLSGGLQFSPGSLIVSGFISERASIRRGK
jgi:hypothetical protein